MYHATRTYLAENAAQWDSLPANVAAADGLGAKILSIERTATKQGAAAGGHGKNKRKLRKTLNAGLQVVADAAAALARAAGNPILLAEVDLTPSEIRNLPDEAVIGTVARVQVEASGAGAALADYGITPAEFTALGDALLDFGEAQAMPVVKRAQRTGLTAALKKLFGETSDFLDGQLDPLMRRYRAANPAFHAGYLAARVVIDLKGPGKRGGEAPEPDPEP